MYILLNDLIYRYLLYTSCLSNFLANNLHKLCQYIHSKRTWIYKSSFSSTKIHLHQFNCAFGMFQTYFHVSYCHSPQKKEKRKHHPILFEQFLFNLCDSTTTSATWSCTANLLETAPQEQMLDVDLLELRWRGMGAWRSPSRIDIETCKGVLMYSAYRLPRGILENRFERLVSTLNIENWI